MSSPSPTGGRTVQPNTLSAAKTLKGEPCAKVLEINVEAALRQHYPPFLKWPAWLQHFVSWVLRLIIRQDRINRFLQKNSHLSPFDFIEAVFGELDFRYHFNSDGFENIPARGGIIIIANHPLGALDGLSVLHLVLGVRKDVKIVANQLLSKITPLAPLLLPVDNMKGDSRKADLANITRALEADQAVIFFPAGEVSRLSARGINDKEWDAGFLRFAERLNMPILPIYIQARNSSLFYAVSRLSSVLSMLMLPAEMVRYSGQLRFHISAAITADQIAKLALPRKQKITLLRKQLYGLPKGAKPVFAARASLIPPLDRACLKDELEAAEELGCTSDGKRIILFTPHAGSAVLDELGRLREQAFRAVGEGTGHSKDTDEYDLHYRHIIVWDEALLEIAGAYRLGEVWKWYAQDKHPRAATGIYSSSPPISASDLGEKLYSAQLFTFDGEVEEIMEAGLELGRSFVQPRFWGNRSLDYLWQGIGAYVARHPRVRYLFGPVSLSAALPMRARDMLVWHYQNYYPENRFFARPKAPFKLSVSAINDIEAVMCGEDLEADFARLREQLGHMQVRVPTLYRQYSDLCHAGGVSFSAFNVDANFSMCLDSFVMVDLETVKASKFERYVQPYL